jgi:hypothetical protein
MRSLRLVKKTDLRESNAIRLSDLPDCEELHSYYSIQAPVTPGSSSNVMTARISIDAAISTTELCISSLKTKRLPSGSI